VTQNGPYRGQIAKNFEFLKISNGGGGHFENHEKIAISRQKIDRSLRNLARLCKMGLLTVQAVKIFNFENPRWPTTAILKTVQWPYLRNRLTDFDKIGTVKYIIFKLEMVDVSHSDANRPANVEVPGICKFTMAANCHFQKPLIIILTNNTANII